MAPRAGLAMPQRQSAAPQQPGARPAMVGGRPVSPTAKADDLVMAMRQLTELLTKENTALKKHRMEEVKALAERKEQLARLYQGHMNAVHKDKNVLAMLEPARKNAIAQSAMKLGDLMQQNASLLKANIESINMFFKSVTEALKNRHEEQSAAYSRSGALGQYAVTKRSLAVSFNQTM
jgi:flagellar biosynthesis/type III secretory pathway chaperone